MSRCTPLTRYTLDGARLDILDWPDILSAARQNGTLTVESRLAYSFAVSDTYNATVLAGGHLLVSEDDGKHLIACADLLPCIHFIAEPVSVSGTAPTSPYRSKYHEGWRLLQLGSISIDTTEFMCRNNAGKGVARLWRVEIKASRSLQLLYFAPLRGYEQEARSYFRFFKYGAGLSPEEENLFPFQAALSLRFPAPTESHTDLEKPAIAILRRRLRAYAEEAFFQIPGIIKDTDPECLHQYRVELRKMRSLISLFKPLLTTFYVQLKDILNTMMVKTNTLRDLDVLLASRREFICMAKAVDRGSLAPDPEGDSDTHSAAAPDAQTPSRETTKEGFKALFKRIKAERDKEQDSVTKWLESEAASSSILRTLLLLKNRSPIWKRLGQQEAMAKVLTQRILKAYTRIKTATIAMTATAAPAEIHSLRILHKRLRYLLDFSLDLHPCQTTLAMLALLKNCQKHLGNYNDAEVQVGWFDSWEKSLVGQLTQSEKAAIAVLKMAIASHVNDLRVQAIEHASECIGPDAETLIQALTNRKEPA